MALVTYEQAKEHLRLSGDAERADLERKLEQATAMIILYIQRPDHGWTTETDPAVDMEFALVQAAICETVGDLYFNRGDQAEDPRALDETIGGAFLPRHVRRMLMPLRSPTCA